MLVTGVNTNELTVTRGTSPGTHADGAMVYRLTQSTLNGNVAIDAESVTVTLNTAALDAAVDSYILIDSEVLKVTNVNSNVLTVLRGQDDTNAAAHDSGDTVYLLKSTLDQQLSSFLPYSNKNSTANVTLVQKSTSVAVSGDFALEFRGQRTGYLPYTSSAYAVEAALEALSTIGSVAVSRTAPDENGGATWSITFLTELGDVPMLTADDLDMTGTAVSATTFLERQGVFPPFNSLDPLNGLPLGSAAITDLADLDLTISKLETRVPYYVRVAAVNALGQGPWTMTTPPYVAPTPFRPGAPVNVSLAVLDATSLRLSLEDPVRDGGDAVDSYRVEWAGEPFVDEVQAVRLAMNATTEVQVVRTELPAWRNFSEVQLIHLKLDDDFDGTSPSGGTSRLETQLVECDASGGSFTFTFDGLTTRSIAYNANPAVVEAALEELTNINDVTVTFTGVGGGATTACVDGGDGRLVVEDGHSPHIGYEAAMNITFNSVTDYVGPVPALVGNVNNLEGLRRIDVYRNREGIAGLGGTYKLRFRGETTAAISFQATDKEVEAALIALDTIQALESQGVTGVNVSDWSSDMAAPYSANERLYAVEFRGSGVGGNVEALQIAEDKLTGSGAHLKLYADGAETAADVRHCVYCASRSGVELGGTFTLTLRRHTTEPIEYNAAASTMKARLEQLPNVGTVDVVRSAPGPRREYAWTISFVSNPGYWPANARDVATLVPDDTTLLPLGANFSRSGVNDGTQRGTTLDRFLNNPPLYPKATVSVSERVKGSRPLQGSFQLTFCNDTRAGLYRAPRAPYPGRFWSPTECDYSGPIPHDASPAAFEAALEAMEHVGDVEVSRASNHDGYTWFVTFGGCKTNRWGDDVCNGGDVATLDWAQPNSTLTGGACEGDYRDGAGAGDCSGLNVTVTEVTRGSGPGSCADGPLGECVATATDLSGGAPYAYDLLGLATGERYYARARWHNDLGFGAYELSAPEYETPSWNAPGAPPPVRLVNSSSVSLAVAWDHPTTDGGAGVMGYELWMDEWAGGRPRLVFDGTDQPDVTEFVVRTRTSVGLESGKQYRFTVRAVNYCNARDADLICRGEFSDPSVFTVRNPRAPMAPLAPRQVSMSAYGVRESLYQANSDRMFRHGQVAVEWRAPVDNGGANITAYQLWMGRPGKKAFEKVPMETFGAGPRDEGGLGSVDVLPGRFGVMRHVVGELDEGELYRFYVQAVNGLGRSAKSPVTSMVAATVPGIDDGVRDGTYGNQSYALVRPTNVDVGETSVHVRWRAPYHNATGGSPISGYRLFMYPGASLNTVADPDPVKQEVQRVVIDADRPSPERQRILFENTKFDSVVRLYVDGKWTKPLERAAPDSEWEHAIANAIGCNYGKTTRDKCVNVTGYDGMYGNTNKTVTFYGRGQVPLMAVDKAQVDAYTASDPHDVSVERLLAGTNELSGSFTLSFRGEETVAIPVDADAVAVKAELENLETISVVTVSRNQTDAFGGFEWMVTFDSEAGDVPLMRATAGRLVDAGTDDYYHRPNVYVETVLPGTPAVLVYDGTDAPDVLDHEVAGLTTDALYAFKVQPFNLLGGGVLSRASLTVAARAGAAAAQTTASGSALSVGMAGVVYEQQVVSVDLGIGDVYVRLGLTPKTEFSAGLSGMDTPQTWEQTLAADNLDIGRVHVTRSNETTYGQSFGTYTVTFLERAGDVPTLELSSGPGYYQVDHGLSKVAEFLKGRANTFTIEPKKASGAPLRDLTASRGREGLDVFFTELWRHDDAGDYAHYADGGVATYNPATYEIQRLHFARDFDGLFTLTYNNSNATGCGDNDGLGYMRGETPQVNLPAHCSGKTEQLGADASPYVVKVALEALGNVEAVDVTRNGTAHDGFQYDVTFTTDLGPRPLLEILVGGAGVSPADAWVSRVQEGVTETQIIVLSSDVEFVPDVQSVHVVCDDAVDVSAECEFVLQLDGGTDTTTTLKTKFDGGGTASTALEVEHALEKLDGINDVVVTAGTAQDGINADAFKGSSWDVTFVSPVGDVGNLVVLDADGTTYSNADGYNVVELVKGESGLGGTFSVAYEGHYSRDIAFDASAATVKTRLQEIASVDEVNVAKEVLGNSIKYTVTFTKQLGNLREMQASPYVYEEQTVTTTGGDPTPLDGTFALTFYNETTAPIPYDAPASAVKAALEALPTLDRVDVAKAERNYGQADWMVTFRSELGDLELLGCDATLLTGSDAACASSEIVAGDAASLTGSTPRVRVEEKVAGLPSYTGSYTPAATGDADVVVRQLVQGGLAAEYFDNAWLQGDPTVVRVDPKIDFDWGHGAVTPYGRDYVSARWSGKVVPPSTDVYTLYVFFDDGARVYVDHELVVDGWENATFASDGQRAEVPLTGGAFHDLVVEWRELTGAARVRLAWSSYSVVYETVPAAALYHASHIAGSPFATTIVPGRADFPFTTATGAALTAAVSGVKQTFRVTTKDATGNKLIRPLDEDDSADQIAVDILGPTTLSGRVDYVGDGEYDVTYTAYTPRG